MLDADTVTRISHPGDVFVFPVERIGRYGACHVVAVDEENQLATVAVLAWTGTQVPRVSEVAGAPRMIKDFYFWTPREVLSNVPLAVPEPLIHIGSLPVTGETKSQSYGSWDVGRDVVGQHRWDAKPHAVTAAFTAALTRDETIRTLGLVYGRGGEQYEAKVASARSFSDDAGYRILEDFRLEALRSWPLLHQLTLHSWRDDLVPFLESSELVHDLTLDGHDQRELDLSRTHLGQLSVDVTGLERLVVPSTLETLILRAHVPGAQPSLAVVAEDGGRWITVRLTKTVLPVRGLERARGLSVHRIGALDLEDVVEYFPEVTWLHLFGCPGTLDHLPALTKLARLETLWLCDLFGYPVEDVPSPHELPALVSLDLDSIPADVAAYVRGAYKKTPRVVLTVRKPRKPEWLAENIDYPLRHWDGQEEIPAIVAKKARTAFVVALRQVRDTDAAAPEFTTCVTAAVEEFVGVVAMLNRKHHFLYTLERDDVIDAVNVLTAGLPAQARRALEPFVEEALDD
ncbi:hypothetical protein SAMN05216410_1816 [Sanguibacter gelidistatuariae]|uniref:Uncharacterized protein n=1 Tax=Sanguibacter gelidistatuariae TaxID=1814289 RepID=A0A1G6LBE9_9MICO|nr:hypothetical protein [Sanguibacter gelidistatuariae]SDC40590.1 hypothetical protein SAMN05216410_1816 [Sanguibacter gelidistatuariae]